MPALARRQVAVEAGGDEAQQRPVAGRHQDHVVLATGDAQLDQLFAGLEYRRIDDTAESGRSLTNEIWRTFLILMALALIGEALLCLPSRRDAFRAEQKSGLPTDTKPVPTSAA